MEIRELVDIILKLSEYTIVELDIRDCSICECPYGYRFVDKKCYFDSNCDCTRIKTPILPRDTDDFIKLLEMNKNTPLYQRVVNKVEKLKEEYKYVN